MSHPIRRGKSDSQVSDWANPNDSFTVINQTSFLNPYGLTLRQTITSSGPVTIPNGINWVYVVMVGGGAGAYFGYGGAGGEVSWGWTVPQNTCIIGAGVQNFPGGYTRYGHIIARGGNALTANYYGIPVGIGYGDNDIRSGTIGSNGGGGGGAPSGIGQGGNGGNGISGGGAGQGSATTGTSTGGNGGSGIVGGGGGRGAGTTTGTRTGGNGGNGLGIDGRIYTGGLGASQTNANGAGGGGAGIAGNGFNASGDTAGNGGLGGGGGGSGNGGTGGNGILYIYY